MQRGPACVLGTAYLEKFKEHVVEVGRHVDDVQRLTGAFGWEETNKQTGGKKKASAWVWAETGPPPIPLRKRTVDLGDLHVGGGQVILLTQHLGRLVGICNVSSENFMS